MKRIAMGVLALAFLAQPALVYAQQDSQSAREAAREAAAEKKREDNNELLKEYHEQQKENARVNQQYQRTLRATDQDVKPTRVDPWANMR